MPRRPGQTERWAFRKREEHRENFRKAENTKLTTRAGMRNLKMALVQIRDVEKAHHKHGKKFELLPAKKRSKKRPQNF
jgi:hypothetical protein